MISLSIIDLPLRNLDNPAHTNGVVNSFCYSIY
jgi:hypothetical protein